MPVVPTLADASKVSQSPMLDQQVKPSDAHLLMAAASMHAMDRLKPASRKAPRSPVKNGKA